MKTAIIHIVVTSHEIQNPLLISRCIKNSIKDMEPSLVVHIVTPDIGAAIVMERRVSQNVPETS